MQALHDPARRFGLRRGCLWIPGKLGLLLVFLSSLALAQGVVRVGVDSDYPPFEWSDPAGQPKGYTVDLFRAVAKSQKLQVEFRTGGWREIRSAFDRGEIDALTGMASSERRIKTINFSIPHSTLVYNILTREGETRIRSERDLVGMKVLAEEGDVLFEYLVAQGIRVEGVRSPLEAIQKLSEGLADCAVVPKLMWLHLEKFRKTPPLQAVPSEVFPAKYCFAVRKGQEELLAKLNEGLFMAKQDGTMDALYNRYMGSLEAADLPLRIAVRRAMPSLLMGVAGLGLLALIAWSWTLRRAVKAKTAALEATIHELEGALLEVKQLSGLIPMCAGCKKIRDDGGYWEAVEEYLGRHTEAQFTHGLCPDCAEVFFPGFQKTPARDSPAKSE